jgi:predicted ferric reductase
LSLAIIRRWVYELFLRVHLALAFSAVIALWRHLSLKKVYARLYTLGGMILWAVLTGLDLVFYIYRNFSLSKGVGRTIVKELDDILRLDVTVPRSWNVKAGQWVYLWMPGVCFWTSSHPFMVTWWKYKGEDLTLSFLVEPRHGLTSKLRDRAETEHVTLIGGPHGRCHDFGDFGTVLMFVSGIGMAAGLPYVKSLVEGANSYKTRTRRILLIWQIEKERMRKLAPLPALLRVALSPEC